MPDTGCALVVWLAAFIVGAIVMVFMASVAIRQSINSQGGNPMLAPDQAQRLASQLKGSYSPARWGNPAMIRMMLGGREAQLQLGMEDAPGFPEIRVFVRGLSPGVLKIRPQGVGASVGKLFGGQDLQVGDHRFDALYVIKANPESLATRLFSMERRSKVIETVTRLGRHSGFAIDLTRECLSISLDFASSEPLLRELVQTAEEMLGHLEAMGSVEVLWQDGSPETTGRCQVCGSEMTERIVRCASCDTPHHRECWDYAGRCSTYACSETRCV